MTTIAPWLSVADAAAAVAFYRRAFGATSGSVLEADGLVQVAEMFLDDAPFWVQHEASTRREDQGDGSGTPAVRMIVMVPDPDAAFADALRAGARSVADVHEEHGWRTGRLADPFGHQWELARRTG